jgi:hypothetical protein
VISIIELESGEEQGQSKSVRVLLKAKWKLRKFTGSERADQINFKALSQGLK